MAEGWGNQVHHWQSYVEASVTSETTTTATITCKTYWHSISWGYSVYGHGYGVIGSTTGSDSGTVVFESGTGASVYQLLTTMTKTITKTDSSQSVTCRGVAIMTGRADANGTSTATCTVTVPAIAYEKPNAPSGCSVSRASDAQMNVTWTNGSTTTTKPRTATVVERSTDGGSWTQVASVGSSTTNYSDKSTSANHRYSYRVRAKNSVGYSSYSTSGYSYTTPAAPSSVTAETTSTTQVRVDATASAPYATGYDVQVSWDGGDWSTVASNASLPVTDSVAGTRATYRARTVRGSLASSWVESAQIVTATTPLAPTVTVSPSGVVAVGETVTVAWSPNHPDGSAQTAATVRITSPSGTTTQQVSGTATTYAVPITRGGSWTFEVRTEGVASQGYGPYSTAATVQAFSAPTVVIDSPATDGAVVDALPLVVAWSVTDDTGTTSAQRVTITDERGAIVYANASVPAGVTSLTLTAADLPTIANETAYIVRVNVTGGSGLNAAASREFATDWAAPALPTATVTNDPETMGVNVTVFEGTGEGLPATASLIVTRIDPAGVTWVVADGMASGDTAVDPLPPLGVTYAYRVTAVTETGATSSIEMTNVMESRAWVFNFGDGAAEVLTMVGNPKASYSLDQGGEAYHFADGGAGDGLPVWYGTTDRDENGTLSFDTVLWQETDRLRELCRRNPVAWIRDPFGHRWRAHVRPRISHGVGQLLQASVTWDAVRYREAW